MGDSEDGFIWTSKEELQNATEDELIEEVIGLQQHVRGLENELSELEELVYLVLDIQAGIGDEFHPELYAHLETFGEDDSAPERGELESDNK
jgi:hypothetical protein